MAAPAPAPAPACGPFVRALPLLCLALALGRLKIGLVGLVPHEGFQSRWQYDDDKLPSLLEDAPQQRELRVRGRSFWDAARKPTLRFEPRSPVPHGGDEDLYEALVAEPLLDWTLERGRGRPTAACSRRRPSTAARPSWPG